MLFRLCYVSIGILVTPIRGSDNSNFVYKIKYTIKYINKEILEKFYHAKAFEISLES